MLPAKLLARLARGFLLVGAAPEDTEDDIDYLAEKIANLRIFADDEGKMNRSALDDGYDMLVVSEFTLHANVRKGRRPSFIGAAAPDIAAPLVDAFVDHLRGTRAPRRNRRIWRGNGRFSGERRSGHNLAGYSRAPRLISAVLWGKPASVTSWLQGYNKRYAIFSTLFMQSGPASILAHASSIAPTNVFAGGTGDRPIVFINK